MRIGELADLAGVTVRTVRHYHQSGVLPEPPRRANGYRDYTVDELVAVLRIRQLTGSGLSLAQAGAIILDESTGSNEEMLDRIDEGLQARIAELTAQRERLAQARSGGPIGLSKLAAALTASPADLPVATLVAHLLGDDRADLLAERLQAPDLQSDLVEAQRRFEAIDAATPTAELDRLAGQIQRIIAELIPHLSDLAADQERLIVDLAERDLNEHQRAFIRRSG